MNEGAKNYEIGFLTTSEQTKEELEKILKSRKMSIINAGQILKTKFAYPIKKESFAYFGFLHFSGAPEDIDWLKNELKSDKKILRYLIISQPAAGEERSRGRFDESSFTAKKSSAEEKPLEFTPRLTKKTPARVEAITNEALEKKLEEILK